MNNYEKLRQVIADIFEVELATINEESSKDTIDMWNSIHQMNLIFALEDAFALHLSDAEVVQLLSVKEIKSILESKGIIF
jgi:acyl carrier protein